MHIVVPDETEKMGQSPANPPSASSPVGFEIETREERPASDPRESAAQMVPPSLITSGDSFTEACEFYSPGDNGKMVFSRTSLLLLDPSNGVVYYGWIEIRKRELSLDQARNCLRRIPDDEIYPLLPADLSALSVASPAPGQHVKRPKFTSYRWSAGTRQLADRFLEEARTLDLLRRKPHPNVAGLEACLVRDGRIIGLLLKQYSASLAERVKSSDDGGLDKAACFRGIVDGVEHPHSLGMAHNDINPSNVMLDEEGRPVIVDLGSCKSFGQTLTEGGTPGWNDGFDETSTLNNDRIGLKKVGEWLGIPRGLLGSYRLTEPSS